MVNGKYRIHLRTKFTLASLILAFVLCIALAVASFFSYRQSMFDRFEERITSVANTAAALIDSATVRDYLERAKQISDEGGDTAVLMDEDYQKIRSTFQTISKENGLEYLTSYHPVSDGLYVFTQGTTEADGEYNYQLGYFSPLGQAYSQKDIDFANSLLKDPDVEKIYISTTQYGYLISGFATVNDASGTPYLVVSADMSMSVVNTVLNNYLLLISIIATAIIAIFITIYLVYLRRDMISPLQKIVDSAIKFVGTDEKLASMDVVVNTHDEIEDLADAFNKMTEDIVRYIQDLTEVTAEKERIGAELNVATRIQASMLPTEFLFPDRDDFKIYASMTPAKEVGGDFYDFFLIDPTHLAVVMADVSGKGVPAALFMVRAKTAIKNAALSGKAPSEIFTFVNAQLCENNEAEMFVTGWMGILNTETGTMTCVNAGHNPPLLKKPDGEFEYLQMRAGFVLAGMEGINYKQFDIQLEKGASLYLYTDGVTEATSAENELYGEDRLLNVLNENITATPSALLAKVKEGIDLFVKEAPQFDDITMLNIQIN